MNISARKTTHSWPVICRQSKHYASDDDEDNNDDNNSNQHDSDDDDDDDEIVFTHKNTYQKINQNPTNTDYLSCRKYLVADYKPKQQIDYHTSTITSVVNAQSDFPISLKAPRNSIVPLMSQSQAQHRETLSETNVSSIHTTAADQTSCIAPPPIIFLLITLLMTLSATGLLCLAVMSDHWETIRWDRNLLEHLTNNTSNRLHWHLDDKVARLPISRKFFIVYSISMKYIPLFLLISS